MLEKESSLVKLASSLIVGLILLTWIIGGITDASRVQELSVFDFSGGLVNSIENNKMGNNMALVFDDWDVFELGGMKRRGGMSSVYIDSLMGASHTQAVIPYYGISEKELLLIRLMAGSFVDTTVDSSMGYITLCDTTTSTCTTIVASDFYMIYRNKSFFWNMMTSSVNNNLLIASSKSEMVVYDGNKIFPARPLEIGQPKVLSMDGGGNLTGRFLFKYSYKDTTADKTSLLSPPSWQVEVENGRIFISNLFPPTDTTVQDVYLIYRSEWEDATGDFGNYALIKTLPCFQGDSIYTVDNNASPSDTIDTCSWALDCECGFLSDGDWPDGNFLAPDVYAPAACSLGISAFVSGANGIFYNSPIDTIPFPTISYVVIYEDSAGIMSYPSAVSCAQYNDTIRGPADSLFVTVSNIPIPSDTTYIVKKHLWRRINSQHDSLSVWPEDSVFGSWYYLTEVPINSPEYIDAKGAFDENTFGGPINIRNNEMCNAANDSNLQNPEDLCYGDSVISFQPTDISYHGNRMFAIGNPLKRDRLYYSDFGRPTTFPFDKFIDINTQAGDWLVRILSTEGRLLLLKQNTILELFGLSFYQFTIRELTKNIGLSFRRALVLHNTGIYFGHTTGLFVIPNYDIPISFLIQNSIDSINDTLGSPYLSSLSSELWYSVPVNDTVNNKVYIYSNFPIPHWKCYVMNINGIVNYDIESQYDKFITNRYLILRNDSLWKWNYSIDDTLDGTELIQAVYQSKYFFDDPAREKIIYVDITGTGICDSLGFTFYADYGQDTLSTRVQTMDFTSGERQRVKVDHIANNFSLKIQDYGTGDYVIKGYTIGYIDDWDQGKKR